MLSVLIGRRGLVILFSFILSGNAFGQGKFDVFQGQVYLIPFDSLGKGYYPEIENTDPIDNIELAELNIPKTFDRENIFGIKRRAGYGILFTSAFHVNQPGCYEFKLESDDGSKLWISDIEFIDNDKPHQMKMEADTIGLTEGIYPIKLWYYNAYPTQYGLILGQRRVSNLDSCYAFNQYHLAWSLSTELLFDFDRFELKSAYLPQLDSLINQLNNKRIKLIEIIGHTDNIGEPKYNEYLSKQRAISVFNYMKEKLDLDLLEVRTIGKGEEEPLAPNSTSKGRTLNRRVEIKITLSEN